MIPNRRATIIPTTNSGNSKATTGVSLTSEASAIMRPMQVPRIDTSPTPTRSNVLSLLRRFMVYYDDDLSSQNDEADTGDGEASRR